MVWGHRSAPTAGAAPSEARGRGVIRPWSPGPRLTLWVWAPWEVGPSKCHAPWRSTPAALAGRARIPLAELAAANANTAPSPLLLLLDWDEASHPFALQ